MTSQSTPHENSAAVLSHHRACYQTALRLLTGRDHSTYELESKLQSRGFPATEIKAVVSECKRLDYLNDEKYSDSLAGRLKRQGFGPLRIIQKLKAKGIADPLINAALDKLYAAEEQAMVCRKELDKKWSAIRGSKDPAQAKAKLYRYLYSRGFSPEIIHQVMTFD